VTSHDAIAPTVPSEHQLDAVPQDAVAEQAAATLPESTAVVTPPEGTTVLDEPAASTELEHAPPTDSQPPSEPESPPVADWGLEDDGSGTTFDWGRGERATEPLSEAPPAVELPQSTSTEPRRASARRGRSRWPAVAGAVALLVLAVGAAIVIGGGGGGGAPPPTPTPAAPKQATASGIGLRHPATWRPADAGSDALPGTSTRWPIVLAPAGAPAGTHVVAGRLPSDGPTLLPEDLLASLPAKPPAATPVRLGKVDAYRYSGLAPRGSDRRADVYVVPTSSGVVTLACVAPAGAPPSFPAACEEIVGSLAISDGGVYPLGPDRAFAKRLNGAMRTLNARRATLRRRLRSEDRAAGQSRDATGLARAFSTAAATVAASRTGPAVAPDRASIVKAMRGTAKQYRALARAAARDDRRAYNQARTGVRRTEAGVQRALRHLDSRSYTVG
jgi:hypothetical protein